MIQVWSGCLAIVIYLYLIKFKIYVNLILQCVNSRILISYSLIINCKMLIDKICSLSTKHFKSIKKQTIHNNIQYIHPALSNLLSNSYE